MEVIKRFTTEKEFDLEQYKRCLGRMEYDDRDVIMYEKMLEFLWEYVIRPGCLADYRGVVAEYCRWNQQMIEKCYYHLPHDLPYANIRRAYQSVALLLAGRVSGGMQVLLDIGTERFQYDGKAPKLLMTKHGRRFVPMSKLFLIYNYYKALLRINEQQAQEFKKMYPYAFTEFKDEEHAEHDRFLHEQLHTYADQIFYPVYERIYKLPWSPADFYMYFEEEKSIPLSKLDFSVGT